MVRGLALAMKQPCQQRVMMGLQQPCESRKSFPRPACDRAVDSHRSAIWDEWNRRARGSIRKWEKFARFGMAWTGSLKLPYLFFYSALTELYTCIYHYASLPVYAPPYTRSLAPLKHNLLSLPALSLPLLLSCYTSIRSFYTLCAAPVIGWSTRATATTSNNASARITRTEHSARRFLRCR